MDGNQETDRITCWQERGIWGDGSCPELEGLVHCRHCPVYTAAGRQRLDRALPEGYLEERTAVMAQQKEMARSGTLSVMVFRLAEEKFALKTVFFQEASEMSPVHTLPLRVNRVFRGVVNINGELLLCVSVTDLLDLTSETRDDAPRKVCNRMMVVSREGHRFVFPVDEILGVHRIVPEDLKEVPATLSRSARGLTRGIFALEGRHVGLLDEDLFFAALGRSLGT